MKEKLQRELNKRGTAEISNGVVNQVTQALDEKPNKVKFLIFGELQEKEIISIDKACGKCKHCYFPTTKQCQERQKKDAEARGFHNLICPQQFVE
jgi:uncharacterized OB-fold protein